jgi:hypothetical protein
MNEQLLHKRVLEGFTSYTLREVAKVIGTALSAWVLSFGVSSLFVTIRATSIDHESSEPITIEPMQVIAKIIDKKVPPTGLATFEKGEMVYLEGFAKFRNGSLPLKRFKSSQSTPFHQCSLTWVWENLN